MNLDTRIKLELKIVKSAVDELFSAGFALGIECDGDVILERTADRKTVLKNMLESDEDILRVYKRGHDDSAWKDAGFIYFVYGESGWDSINDYSVSLEPHIPKTLKLVDDLCKQYG